MSFVNGYLDGSASYRLDQIKTELMEMFVKNEITKIAADTFFESISGLHEVELQHKDVMHRLALFKERVRRSKNSSSITESTVIVHDNRFYRYSETAPGHLIEEYELHQGLFTNLIGLSQGSADKLCPNLLYVMQMVPYEVHRNTSNLPGVPRVYLRRSDVLPNITCHHELKINKDRQ